MTDESVRWTIKGKEFVHCNCAAGCPCQFNSLPSHGHCQAVAAIEIEEGRHGETDLSGLRIGMIVKWPGAIHEGRGQVVPIVDERADENQREALLRIMSGLDTVPGSTFFHVFSQTFEKVHDPVFAPIDLDVDVDGRTARLDVPGWIEARGEPIKNPVTGAVHRARIDLPMGKEFNFAEVASGTSEAKGAIGLRFEKTHAHLVRNRMSSSGIARL